MRKTLRIWWVTLWVMLTKSWQKLCLHFYKLIGKIEEHEGKNIW